MKVASKRGRRYRKRINGGLKLVYEFYVTKYTTEVHMVLARDDDREEIRSESKTYINWERFGMSRERMHKRAVKLLNAQSQRVAGTDIAEESQ